MEKLNLALQHICQEIGGDWLLLGGSLICFHVDPTRGTEDIDLVRMDSDSVADKTFLINEMKKLGVSPEQLNSAVGFFLNQIPKWREHVLPLISGTKGKIFRPNLTLFAILKFKRGTPVDLKDVKAAAQKWGKEEFIEEIFSKWAGEKEIKLAQELGLLK